MPNYSWCSLPFSEYLIDYCKPYTIDQLREMQSEAMAKIRERNPELYQLGMEAGDQAVAAYCRAHPVECGEVYGYSNSPLLARVFGPGFTAEEIGPDGRPDETATPGWLILLAIGAGVFILSRKR